MSTEETHLLWFAEPERRERPTNAFYIQSPRLQSATLQTERQFRLQSRVATCTVPLLATGLTPLHNYTAYSALLGVGVASDSDTMHAPYVAERGRVN
jgi:hypothetical protein